MEKTHKKFRRNKRSFTEQKVHLIYESYHLTWKRRGRRMPETSRARQRSRMLRRIPPARCSELVQSWFRMRYHFEMLSEKLNIPAPSASWNWQPAIFSWPIWAIAIGPHLLHWSLAKATSTSVADGDPLEVPAAQGWPVVHQPMPFGRQTMCILSILSKFFFEIPLWACFQW